ncbi:alpha/beta fold hydrolase [Krasilnikovia sp. MM14-A1259]|uniref:thioesterase domain-containing protein n=1 Tax=Krasilnikovia sp. MM14-A1259 TaxID=3373539 RepID=UPI00381B9855
MTSGHNNPRDALEMQVQGVFQDVLGARSIGLEDDFISLGGNSFLAAVAVDEFERLLGAKISLNDFLQCGSVARIASLLRTGPLRRSHTVIRLSAGGGGAPVFAFHPLPGTVLCYQPLADALGDDHTVWGLQSPGIESDDPLATDIETMAATCVAAVRQQVTVGRWHLVGYSMGGLIAFEAARQLRLAGEDVGHVGLIDTPFPTKDLPPPGAVIRTNAIRTIAQFILRVDVDAAEMAELSHRDQITRLVGLGVAAGTLPPDYDATHLERWLRVRIANRTAESAYRPTAYPGPVTVYRARAAGDYIGQSRWRRIAGEISVVDVDAEHLHMLNHPYVDQISVPLTRALGEADR